MKWNDKKDFSPISAMHMQLKREETMSRHKFVINYNDKMGGVDKVNYHVTAFSTQKRGKKYLENIFFYSLNSSLLNSCILFCKVLEVPF